MRIYFLCENSNPRKEKAPSWIHENSKSPLLFKPKITNPLHLGGSRSYDIIPQQTTPHIFSHPTTNNPLLQVEEEVSTLRDTTPQEQAQLQDTTQPTCRHPPSLGAVRPDTILHLACHQLLKRPWDHRPRLLVPRLVRRPLPPQTRDLPPIIRVRRGFDWGYFTYNVRVR